MPDVTYYVALPFGLDDDGPSPREAIECTSASMAVRSAEALSHKEGNVGASRTGDPGPGEFSDAVLLKAFARFRRI